MLPSSRDYLKTFDFVLKKYLMIYSFKNYDTNDRRLLRRDQEIFAVCMTALSRNRLAATASQRIWTSSTHSQYITRTKSNFSVP